MIGSGHSRSSFKMDTPAAKSCCELVGSLAVHMPVSAEARAVTSTHSPNIGLTRKTLRSEGEQHKSSSRSRDDGKPHWG